MNVLVGTSAAKAKEEAKAKKNKAQQEHDDLIRVASIGWLKISFDTDTKINASPQEKRPNSSRCRQSLAAGVWKFTCTFLPLKLKGACKTVLIWKRI